MYDNLNKPSTVIVWCIFCIFTHQPSYAKSLDDAVGGLVIISNEYIEPPYTISVEELRIMINGRKIPKPECSSGEGLLFGERPIDSLTESEKHRFIARLEVAKKRYQYHLNRGDSLIFDNDGFRVINILSLVYQTPSFIQSIRSQSEALNGKLEMLYEKLLYVDEFGETEGISVDQGFLFCNSEYIDAPYVISRKGLGLFANGRLIVPPPHWSPTKENAGIISQDPNQILKEITTDSSKYDLEVWEYINAKSELLKGRSEKDKMSAIVKEYKKLPCVISVRMAPDNNRRIIVEWTDGNVERINPFPPIGGRMIDQDKESLLRRVESERANYEARLKKGDYYIMSSSGRVITGNRQSAYEFLPPIIDLIRSEKDKDKVLKEMKKNKKIYDLGKEIVESIDIEKFKASSQLEKRLKSP